MIESTDVDFHTPADAPADWCETNYFSLHVPVADLLAWVYLVFRPGVGAVAADVTVLEQLGTRSIDATYVDFQQHLPIPGKLSDFSLPNGLSLRVTDPPRGYHLTYEGPDGTALDVQVDGVMEPYDIHDPDMDPLAVRDTHAAAETSGFGAAYASHFDMTARVTGTLTVRGRRFDVDCIATMDHSWGPRGERGQRPMVWLNANFDERNAVNTIWSLNPSSEGTDQYTFRHGYVLDDGVVKGLTGGSLEARRFQLFPVSYEMALTDLHGDVRTYQGSTRSMFPWTAYACTFVPTGYIRWNHGERIGYGVSQENFPLDRQTGGLR